MTFEITETIDYVETYRMAGKFRIRHKVHGLAFILEDIVDSLEIGYLKRLRESAIGSFEALSNDHRFVIQEFAELPS